MDGGCRLLLNHGPSLRPWRPGHFDGVVTVVIRLLGLVRPHQLWLGERLRN